MDGRLVSIKFAHPLTRRCANYFKSPSFLDNLAPCVQRNSSADPFEMTDTVARLDVEMGPLLQNHGADRIPIIVDALVLETLREQQAWASARKEHAACEQRVMSGHEANTESKAQLDIRLILPLAGIESSSERSSIAGSWSFDPHTARTREQ